MSFCEFESGQGDETTRISLDVQTLCSEEPVFGIWYHGAGTIRGADLATKLRYQPGDELPAMFDQVGG
jgi:hypothetical protein